MKINQWVTITFEDKYMGKSGVIKMFQDKMSYNIGVKIDGIPTIVWFSEGDFK